ncbi:MAG: NACHT domain-containing protein, partial [bacterium]|nr:NACHT domain-containing protein [bacterium]
EEAEIKKAFADFFSQPETRLQFEKIPFDRYEEVDFEALELGLRACCRIAECQPPETDLYQMLELWARDLQTTLKRSPDYYKQYQAPIEKAIQDLSRREAEIGNHSLARLLYRKTAIRLHRYISFTGMAEISGDPEIGIERVFVMPRVARKPAPERGEAKEPEPVAASELLRGPNRAVILGDPGSGKTTLCRCLVLALAERESGSFPWTRGLPPLLPVFYRVRELDQDLLDHPGDTIWECLGHRYSRLVGRTLPKGFFYQVMKSHGLLLLFDGLDEAGSPARRKDIINMVSGFSE